MSMQDQIADMATRIRNAQMAGLKSTSMPSSKLKMNIAECLEKEGYIKGFEVSGDVKKVLNVKLKYHKERPVIEMIQRVSKPGLRRYTGYRDLTRVKDGLGVMILSTSQGIKTDQEVRQLKIGGECLLQLA